MVSLIRIFRRIAIRLDNIVLADSVSKNAITGTESSFACKKVVDNDSSARLSKRLLLIREMDACCLAALEASPEAFLIRKECRPLFRAHYSSASILLEYYHLFF